MKTQSVTIASTVQQNNNNFMLQLNDWRFFMIEELHVFFARKYVTPLMFIYDLRNAYTSHLILSEVINRLNISSKNIDYGSTGKPLQGRYLICYYSKQMELIGPMAPDPNSTIEC